MQHGKRVMVLITRWNMMLCEYSWPLCTVCFCSHLIFYVLYLFEDREKLWKYFKLRYGYLLWFSTLSHFSFVFVVFLFSKGKPYLLIFFLNVLATNCIFLTKNCESVKWCSIEIKKKSFIDFIHVSLIPWM